MSEEYAVFTNGEVSRIVDWFASVFQAPVRPVVTGDKNHLVFHAEVLEVPITTESPHGLTDD